MRRHSATTQSLLRLLPGELGSSWLICSRSSTHSPFLHPSFLCLEPGRRYHHRYSPTKIRNDVGSKKITAPAMVQIGSAFPLFEFCAIDSDIIYN